MSDFKVASRYAKSLIALALEKGQLEEVYVDMKMLYAACDASRELRLLLTSPVIKSDKKLSILQLIYKGKVNEITMAFFSLMTKKRREAVLHSICGEFMNEYLNLKKTSKATVVTPTAITESQLEEFKALVRRISGREVQLEHQIDPSIIGGFILNTEDRQLDTSVSGALNSIKKNFISNPFISKY